jgi:hypothetical protein
MERLGLALLAILFALAIVLWLYGVYCYIQMVRHRDAGTSPYQLAWPSQHLTERGREFRRRALRAYAAFGLLALLLLLLATILGTWFRRRAV